MGYLLFDTNLTEQTQIPLEDGSNLSLVQSEDGWFCEDKYKDVVDERGWNYTQVSTITFKPRSDEE
jgi:hypothetical protein